MPSFDSITGRFPFAQSVIGRVRNLALVQPYQAHQVENFRPPTRPNDYTIIDIRITNLSVIIVINESDCYLSYPLIRSKCACIRMRQTRDITLRELATRAKDSAFARKGRKRLGFKLYIFWARLIWNH